MGKRLFNERKKSLRIAGPKRKPILTRDAGRIAGTRRRVAGIRGKTRVEGLLHRDEERLKVVMIGRISHRDVVVGLGAGEGDKLLLLDALYAHDVTREQCATVVARRVTHHRGLRNVVVEAHLPLEGHSGIR